ncbi:head decoration protein [Salipiger abyssi]|uniref:Bacteriophage lambda head decoration protein D n=1 Tax=Salipiger abyssi TaxID=1250539 RepID=A0A1P8UWH2_9RHOB|nr:head decoration protein [Salipiger abyssi]APZ53739.1 Bacteriophage lambda head decoration protein D [Salipiger abyssi]
MAILSEGATPGDFLLFEEQDAYSREEVIIAAGADLIPGAVLGMITASKKYVASDEAAADGSEDVAAVLLTPALAAEADVPAIVLKRHARVRRGGLIFDASYDTETKRDAACAELKALGILVT